VEVWDIPQTGDAATATAELFKNWLLADRQGGTPGFMNKPPLEQSWGKVIFLTGVDYFSTFRKRAQAISSAPIGAATTEGQTAAHFAFTKWATIG
jgi:hypothetical protein